MLKNAISPAVHAMKAPCFIFCFAFLLAIPSPAGDAPSPSTNAPAFLPSPDPSTMGGKRSNVADMVTRATVTIETSTSSGSGFFFKQDEKFWIVSNTAVIGQAFNVNELSVRDSEGRPVKLLNALQADIEGDIAILQLPSSFTPDHFLAPSTKVTVGEKILVAGNAKEGGAISILEGTIRGLGSQHGIPILDLTAPLTTGMSGGPIVNDRGELVGITTFVASLVKEARQDVALKDMFSEPKPTGIRATRIREVQPLPFAHLFLHHKADQDREAIFTIYFQSLTEENFQRISEFVDTYLVMADKAVMPDRSFDGVRPSGMLDDYYDALKSLKTIAGMKYQWNVEVVNKRPSGDPFYADTTAKLLREEKNFLQKLKTRKTTPFTSQELHNYIDLLVEARLQKQGS